MRQNLLGSLFFLVILNPLSLQADDGPTPTETRLRQALRDTIGQLRDAQNQLVTVEAAQAQSDKDRADLQAKLEAVTAQLKSVSDQAAADKAASDKALADLEAGKSDLVRQMTDALTRRINALDRPGVENEPELSKSISDLKAQNPEVAPDIDQFGIDIQLWTKGYVQYAQLETKTETERAQLAAEKVTLQRVVADREAKNLALDQLGEEILARYEHFGLGDALGAKEPFLGLSRIKLQNLVQDYRDKLRDQVVRPGQAVPGNLPAVAPAPAVTQQ